MIILRGKRRMREGRKEGGSRNLCAAYGFSCGCLTGIALQSVQMAILSTPRLGILSSSPRLRQELEPGRPSGVHIQLQPRGSEVPRGRVAAPSGGRSRRARMGLRSCRRRNCGQRRCSLGHVCHAMRADPRGSHCRGQPCGVIRTNHRLDFDSSPRGPLLSYPQFPFGSFPKSLPLSTLVMSQQRQITDTTEVNSHEITWDFPEGPPQYSVYHLRFWCPSPISELSDCGSASVCELSRAPSRLLTPTLEALYNMENMIR